MEDGQIVDLFWSRSDAAIANSKQKYGRYCRYIAYNILQNDSDAEEIENDVYLKAWNSIPPNRPSSLKAYLGMISRQLAFDAYAAKNTQKRGGDVALVLDELAECIPDSNGGEDIGESLALHDALNGFVRSLSGKTQKIFVRRYWYSSSVSEIAADYGMSENHVSVSLFNTRKKLKRFLSKEGFTL